MTLSQDFLVLCGIAALAFATYRQTKRLKLPVRFASVDELTAVARVAFWAQRRFDHRDPRWEAIFAIGSYLRIFASFTRIGARISAQDVAVLAPFIDQFIAGDGPPSILSVEYEDERPALLGAFKARMQAEGLWPREDTQKRV